MQVFSKIERSALPYDTIEDLELLNSAAAAEEESSMSCTTTLDGVRNMAAFGFDHASEGRANPSNSQLQPDRGLEDVRTSSFGSYFVPGGQHEWQDERLSAVQSTFASECETMKL